MTKKQKEDELVLLNRLEPAQIKKLTEIQKDRMREVGKNLDEIDVKVFLKIYGQTPAQVRNLLLEEYMGRYKVEAWFEQLKQCFPPCRKWGDLDLAIQDFYRNIEQLHAENYDEVLDFWGTMRHLIHALPRKALYALKYESQEDGVKMPPRGDWWADECELCWRSVPIDKVRGRRHRPRCWKHEGLASSSGLYRKLKKLLDGKDFRDCYAEVIKQMRPYFAGNLTCIQKNVVLLHILTTDDTPFPRLMEYLQRVGHDGTPTSLLRAFHGPFTDDMPDDYRAEMEKFIEAVIGFPDNVPQDIKDKLISEVGFPFDEPFLYFVNIELVTAETWLTVLQMDGRCKKKKGKDE